MRGFTKYFLMDDGGDFVEVSRNEYENIPENMISNKIKWDHHDNGSDFYDMDCMNVDAGCIRDFLVKVGFIL